MFCGSKKKSYLCTCNNTLSINSSKLNGMKANVTNAAGVYYTSAAQAPQVALVMIQEVMDMGLSSEHWKAWWRDGHGNMVLVTYLPAINEVSMTYQRQGKRLTKTLKHNLRLS